MLTIYDLSKRQKQLTFDDCVTHWVNINKIKEAAPIYYRGKLEFNKQTVDKYLAEYGNTLELREALKSRDTLAFSVQGMAVKEAQKFITETLTLENLLQHAQEGIMRAISLYCPYHEKEPKTLFDTPVTHEVKFSSYALAWIKQRVRACAESEQTHYLGQGDRKFALIPLVENHHCDPLELYDQSTTNLMNHVAFLLTKREQEILDNCNDPLRVSLELNVTIDQAQELINGVLTKVREHYTENGN